MSATWLLGRSECPCIERPLCQIDHECDIHIIMNVIFTLKSGYQQCLSIVLCCESHVLTYIWAPMASLWFYILFKIRSLFCTDILEFRSAKPALATLQTPQSLCCNYKLNALKTKTDLDIMLLGCQCCQIFPFIQLHLQTGFATTCLKDFIL